MMDSDVIQKLLAKKKRLDQTDEAQCVFFVFEQLYGGDWDAHYAACDLHLVAFGAKAGVMDVPDEILEPNKYATYLENVVSTLSTLGLVIAPKKLKSKTNSIIRALRIMRKYAHYHDAFTFGESVKGSYSKVENQVQLVFHLHKRVIEKVLTLLFTRSLDELASGGGAKIIKHIERFQSYVNTLAFGSETKPGHWKCPIKNGDEVGDCSFTDMQAKDIEEKLGDIIEKAFTLEKSRKDDWHEVKKR
jgi:hypothetical protein